jgi:beta-glucanase (GH16 family)
MNKRSLVRKLPKLNANVIAVIIVAIIGGIIAVLVSRAATTTASLEPETGTLATNASVFSNVDASSGKGVKFSPPTVAGSKCANLANLKFCDDFDGAANLAPDSSKWQVLTGSSWGGHCFKNLRENIATDGTGNLKMTLIKKSTTQCTDSKGNATSVTSGGMDTGGKQYFHYGKYEIRAKLSCAKSVWGSIWMSTGSGPSWPQSGEIDIYEIIGSQLNRLQQTLWAGNPTWHQATYYTISSRLCDDFHVYGMDWRPGYVQFMLDGQNTNKLTKSAMESQGRIWPFDSYDLRMLIDLQYGGPGWPDQGPYDFNELPSSMLIDYVHVFN